VPLFIAAFLPALVVAFSPDQQSLMELYAIGVVARLRSTWAPALSTEPEDSLVRARVDGRHVLCSFRVENDARQNQTERALFHRLHFVSGLRFAPWRSANAGLRTITVSREVAAAVAPESMPDFRINLKSGQAILVAARGMTPVLRFALEEARLRKGMLYVLFVKELAVALPRSAGKYRAAPLAGRPASRKKSCAPFSNRAGKMKSRSFPCTRSARTRLRPILDLSATLGIDILMLVPPTGTNWCPCSKAMWSTEVAGISGEYPTRHSRVAEEQGCW